MKRSTANNAFLTRLVIVLSLLWAASASAVPSYARQTGQACSACHVGAFGPQLNGFGRQFKLLGYTMSNGKSSLPLSAMLVESYSQTSKDLSDKAGPYDGTNNNAALQQLSLFVAGKLSTHIGMFSQITYSDIDR
ncbi:MAG TPA: cytochrome C, partial [Luteimonas sp.]|nr:cytochrome C [Luteimonas sp.]